MHRSALLIAAFFAGGAALAHGTQTHADGPNLEMVEKSFGRTGDPKKVTRTIHIGAHDTMRYTPSRITIRQGETIRFVVANRGKAFHETVLGTIEELREHAEWMKKHPTMEHDAPYMVHLPPGRKGEMVWQFTQAGEFYFACLIPGHFEAGMLGSIEVVPTGQGD
ncbi:MAG: plastocyanin/azurin family copper-binding protein [Burkholderiaceae bacterium]